MNGRESRASVAIASEQPGLKDCATARQRIEVSAQWKLGPNDGIAYLSRFVFDGALERPKHRGMVDTTGR